MVYLSNLPGGWVADRILGQRRSVLLGGIVIATGHFLMAIPRIPSFYAGLAFIVVGTGLLKPNISTMVGALYTPNDTRRDAGFSLFYMGINLGAMLSPLVCGYLGQNINWHYGFAAAGAGMCLGLIQYVLGGRYLGDAGQLRTRTPADLRIFKIAIASATAIVAAVAALTFTGALRMTAEAIANAFAVLLLLVVVVFFTWLLTAKGYTHAEHRRFWAILVLFAAACLFWSAFEQAGSTLNLFAERNTNLHAWDFRLWGSFRASYYQSVNSIFIILLAPLFGWLWLRLGRRQPGSTAKFSIGLLFVGLGFAILIPVAASTSVSPWWLILTYLLHTIGELSLSPVGLSAMTRLAPARAVGMMMGVWFLAYSVGSFIGGRLSSLYESFPLPALFAIVAGFCLLVAAALVFLIRPMRRLTAAVD
jgi:POT family proton-dependent oligopeptide transporter